MDVSLIEAAISMYDKVMLHHEIARNDIKMLYIASLLGNAADLTQLLNENVDLLEDVLLTRADTPLHIAARFGHLNFVRAVLTHKPSLAWELDQDGFSAISLASENGHVAIVKELLACDPRLCKLKDRDGRTLLHCAAIHGRLEILHELLTNFVDCIGELTARGETALHLALKNNQEEAFLMLMGWIKQTNNQGLLEWKDKSGNTVLKLVESTNTYEGTHELTLTIDKGVTGLDRLSQTCKTFHIFQHHKFTEKRKQPEHWRDKTLKYPGTDQAHQKHEILTTAWFIISLAIFLLGSSWTQTCQLDKKLRLESMLFHFQMMFNIIGVISAASMIIFVLTGFQNDRQRLLLLVVSAYSTFLSYASAIAVVYCSLHGHFTEERRFGLVY